MSDTGRIRYIDFIKAFGIILVVLGHINFANSAVKAWIYAFHMPIFFFATGLTKKTAKEQNASVSVWSILYKNFWRLLVPYMLWGLIYARFEWENLARLLYGSRQTIGGADSLSSLWFLTAMFLAVAGFDLLAKALKKRFTLAVKLVIMLLCFIVSALLPRLIHGYPFCFDAAVCALGFMLAGNAAAPCIKKLSQTITEKKGFIMIPLIAALAGLAGTFLYRLNIPESGYVNMSMSVYGVFPLFVITAFCGIILVLGAGMFLEAVMPNEKNVISKALTLTGKSTLFIMMMHKPVIDIFVYLFSRVSVPNAAVLILTSLGTVALCCPAAMAADRFFPFLTGKYMPEKKKGADGKKAKKSR